MIKYKIIVKNKKELIERIQKISSKDHDLVINGFSSYSVPYNYGADTAFDSLIKSVFEILKNKYKNNIYEIIDMWFNIYKKGGYVKEHNHTSKKYEKSDLKTGIFYLKKPLNSGELYINNKEIKLNENDFIIFDAEENHYTTKNKTNEDRIVISFNFLRSYNR